MTLSVRTGIPFSVLAEESWRVIATYEQVLTDIDKKRGDRG